MERAAFIRSPLFQAVAVGALACLFGILTFQKDLNINGDNACYICLAKSLAEGQGFRLPNDPHHPRNELFPLGYPLFLSLFIRAFGVSLPVLKSVMVALFAACLLLFFLLARGLLSGRYLAAAMVLSLTNYWLLDNASINMSELFYMVFLLASLIFFLRFSLRNSGRDLAVVCVLTVLSIFIRSVGIAFLLALILFLLYRKRWFIAAASLAGYLVLNALHRPLLSNPAGYFSVLFMKDPYQPYLGMWTLGEFFVRVKTNVAFYLGNVIQMTLLSFNSDMQGLSPAAVLIFSALIAALLLAYPFRRILSSGFDLFLRGAILLYMGVLMVRPEVWSGSRFVVPLIPLLYLIALQNLQWLGGRFLRAEYLPRAQNIMLAVAILWSVLNFGEAFRKSHTPLTEDWADFNALAAWAGKHTDTSAVFCARSPFIFYLKSDRRCVGIPLKPSAAAAMQYLEDYGVDYVVIDRFRWTGSTQKHVVPLLLAHPERFQRVTETGKDKASIYRMVPQGREE